MSTSKGKQPKNTKGSANDDNFNDIDWNIDNDDQLRDTIRRVGGILLNNGENVVNVKGASKSNTTSILNRKYCSACHLVSRISELVQKKTQVLNSKTESVEILLEVIKIVKTVAAKKECNYLFRQIGLMNHFNSLMARVQQILEESEASEELIYNPHLLDLMNETSQAIDMLKKTSEDSLNTFGYGYDKNTGMFDWMIQIGQNNYDNVGMAWTIWDAAIILSQWIYDNKEYFIGKKVLELGSGCGLSGIVAALYADQVVLSDYTPEIDKFLKENIKLNEKVCKTPPLTAIIDWNSEQVLQQPPCLRKGMDVIIGADIFFHPELTPLLARCVDRYLAPKGVFYGTSSSIRIGIKNFVAEMKKLGYIVNDTLPGQVNNIAAPDNHDMIYFHCYKDAIKK